MLSDEYFQKLAFFLISFNNFKAAKKAKKAGYGPCMGKIPSKSQLSSFGYIFDEINAIINNYNKVALEEIKKAESVGVEIIHIEENDYPQLLKEIYDPPEFLYVKGDKAVLNSKNVLAIVGSRRNNSYGKDILNAIIPELCRGDLIIVSGMAYGIDSIAHSLTVKNNGKTIGVNAGGLLHIYPKGNSTLFPHIVNNGCIISEFPIDVIPRPFYFPVRNRIISGISKAVFVVQATLRSGSLITARVALEQNRDVFTTPGHIYSPLSYGPHYLLKQGAKLIENGADILEEFGINLETQKPKNIDLTKNEIKLLDLMDDYGVKRVDYFIENSDFNISEIISILMGLVLKGVLIENEQGYRRIGNE